MEIKDKIEPTIKPVVEEVVEPTVEETVEKKIITVTKEMIEKGLNIFEHPEETDKEIVLEEGDQFELIDDEIHLIETEETIEENTEEVAPEENKETVDTIVEEVVEESKETVEEKDILEQKPEFLKDYVEKKGKKKEQEDEDKPKDGDEEKDKEDKEKDKEDNEEEKELEENWDTDETNRWLMNDEGLYNDAMEVKSVEDLKDLMSVVVKKAPKIDPKKVDYKALLKDVKDMQESKKVEDINKIIETKLDPVKKELVSLISDYISKK